MKGTYLLIIDVKKDISLTVGSLGKISFSKGCYCYVGSAMGPGENALENRINRHLKNSENKKFHWHIDYFLGNKNVSIKNIFVLPSKKKLECFIANEIKNNSKEIYEVSNFGSSDCFCPSHLFNVKNL